MLFPRGSRTGVGNDLWKESAEIDLSFYHLRFCVNRRKIRTIDASSENHPFSELPKLMNACRLHYLKKQSYDNPLVWMKSRRKFSRIQHKTVVVCDKCAPRNRKYFFKECGPGQRMEWLKTEMREFLSQCETHRIRKRRSGMKGCSELLREWV